jgi:triacylglycerol lipase
MSTIVLAHGYPGFVKIGRLDYFNGVADFLTNELKVRVLTPEVAPVGTIEERSKELGDQIEKEFNGEKVHIIAHSAGGLDARRLISPQGGNRSDLVASLTTISTPHGGTSLAEVVLGLLEPFTDAEDLLKKRPSNFNQVKSLADTLFGDFEDHLDLVLGGLFGGLGANTFLPSLKVTSQDLIHYLRRLLMFDDEGLKDLTRDSLRQFNKRFGDAPHVDYFSYAGVAGPGERDSLPPMLYLSYLIVTSQEGRNDGWIAVESAKHQKFEGEIPADHAQEIGHDLSLVSRVGLFNRRHFDHLEFYKEIVQKVKGRPTAR